MTRKVEFIKAIKHVKQPSVQTTILIVPSETFLILFSPSPSPKTFPVPFLLRTLTIKAK